MFKAHTGGNNYVTAITLSVPSQWGIPKVDALPDNYKNCGIPSCKCRTTCNQPILKLYQKCLNSVLSRLPEIQI